MLVFILSMLLFVNLLPEYGDMSFVLALFISGAFASYMGKKWNEEEGRTMIDKANWSRNYDKTGPQSFLD